MLFLRVNHADLFIIIIFEYFFFLFFKVFFFLFQKKNKIIYNYYNMITTLVLFLNKANSQVANYNRKQGKSK